MYIINTTIKLVFSLIIILFVSCSGEEDLGDKIVGDWLFKSWSTDCIPEDVSMQNKDVEAGSSGCATIEFQDSTGTFVITTSEVICMSITFKNDNSGYIISGNPLSRDSLPMNYKIQEASNNVEICIPNGFCADYFYDGKEVSIELPIATMDSSECTRTFVYEK